MTALAQGFIQAEIERMEDLNADQIAEDLQLYSWGRWCRAHGETLGYAHLKGFEAKGTWEPDLRRHIGVISDEEAIRIDAAVCKLRGTQRTIIKAIYLEWIPWRKLPEVLGVSVNTIRKYQHQGLGALEVLLSEARQCRH